MRITNNTEGKAIFIILTSFISFLVSAPYLYADDSYLLDSPAKENYRLDDYQVDDDYSTYYEVNPYERKIKNKRPQVKNKRAYDQERYNFINGIGSEFPINKSKANTPPRAKPTADRPRSNNQASKPYVAPPMSNMSKNNSAPRAMAKPAMQDISVNQPDVNFIANTNNNQTMAASNSNIPENYEVNLFAGNTGNTSKQQDSEVQKPFKAEYVPENMERNMQQLSKAGESINSAINTLENIERYKKNRIIRVIDEDMVKYGLGSKVQVDWTGPIEPLLREIAAVSGYNFKIVGMSPAIPVLVSSIHDNVEIGDIAREAHLQSKDRADVVIYPKNKTIEIRYTELG